jgi:peptidoglycan/xylan/chitin deacetylase (PgdA/CDA1 family)
MKINILTEEEASLLREDIVAAHQEMARYIGDTGALKLFFRPPTLAVSKLGLETIFDCGYQYIINGDFSTHDYEAESAEELIDNLKNGMGNRRIMDGSIVVMHMSDTSKYTAEALDVVIPYYQAQGYRFAKLSDYLKH